MTEQRQPVQLQNWAVCQLCGYFVPMEEATKANGWLVAPYKPSPELNVVRCPRHISEWSLRNSVGRTTEWRRIMRAGKMWEPPSDPFLRPFPTSD